MSVKKFLKSIKFPGLDSVYEVPVTSVNGMTGDVEVSGMLNPIPYDYMPEGYPKKSGVDVITWDGNTKGLVSATDEYGYTYYKMSDAVLTLDELVGVTIKIREQDGSVYENKLVSKGFTTPPDGINSEFIAVANVDNAVLDHGLVLPEAGTYFMRSEEKYIIELPVSTVKVEPIAYEFMPEGYPKIDREAVTIFDQTVEGFADGGYGAYTAIAEADFEAFAIGDRYDVVWDGVEYTNLIAQELQYGMAFIGPDPNSGITEELPFMIAAQNGNCMFGTNSTESSHSVSVTHVSEVVTPMAEEFLPAKEENYLHVQVTENDDSTYAASKTFEEIKAAFDAGKMVYCTYPLGARICRCMALYENSSTGGEGFEFTQYYRGTSGTNGTLNVCRIASDNTCTVGFNLVALS